MGAAAFSLKPVAGRDAPCKICRGKATLFGVVDFNKSCEDRRGAVLPPAGVPVHYRRCGECGFLFTECFDDWTISDFKAHIYDECYAAVDPDFAEKRPASLRSMLDQLFPALPRDLRILDYGGGEGALTSRLKADGFTAVAVYDPLVPDYAALPSGPFDLITCFETLEHVPDPVATVRQIAGLAALPGLVLFSTLVQGPEFQRLGMGWWYIGPRNGHISLFTTRALTLAWAREGYRVASLTGDLHLAFRQMPDFARHLVRKPA
ncbi:MAG TPA: class I SAM-dependent methyltransferase [Stellaceae bacterium]|nr:class I SAM-dependent methyltransferase [Stellaceae bacterium]